jgi:hypothetical protein
MYQVTLAYKAYTYFRPSNSRAFFLSRLNDLLSSMETTVFAQCDRLFAAKKLIATMVRSIIFGHGAYKERLLN